MAIIWKWGFNWNWNDASWSWYNLTVSNVTYWNWLLNQWWVFNWSTSSATSATWLWISLTNYTLNAVINPTSIPAWSDFWEIFWLFNASAQYIIWLMIYQSKYYTLQWVWWANWLVQPTTPTPASWRRELITVVWSTTAITLYRNWIQIGTAWSWSFSWTVNQIKIWVWKYVWLIDEASLSNDAQNNTYIKNQYLLLNWYI